MKYLIGKKRRKLRSKPSKKGTAMSPRIAVFRSNQHIYAQAIDDVNATTLAASSTVMLNASKNEKADKTSKSDKSDKAVKANKENKADTKTILAKQVGLDLGQKLMKLKIKNAYFDRAGYKYHGRVKAIADGVRESGVTI